MSGRVIGRAAPFLIVVVAAAMRLYGLTGSG